MDTSLLFRRVAGIVNKPVLPLLRLGPVGRLLGGSTAIVSYTGRKSGKQVTLPVNFRREGADVVIRVMAPDAKTWWRNFADDGAPIQVRFGSVDHAGHAVVVRGAKGSVAVRVTLD